MNNYFKLNLDFRFFSTFALRDEALAANYFNCYGNRNSWPVWDCHFEASLLELPYAENYFTLSEFELHVGLMNLLSDSRV